MAKKQQRKAILYYDDTNSDSRSALMLLNLLDVDVDCRFVDLMRGDHLTDEYGLVNSVRMVPTFVHEDISVSGHAILVYICENFCSESAQQLLGCGNYRRRMRILNRLFYESKVMSRRYADLMMDLMTKTPDQLDFEYHQERIEDIYDALEIYLECGCYMAGSKVTLADIAFVSTIAAMNVVFPLVSQPDRWFKVRNWFKRMCSMPDYDVVLTGVERQRIVISLMTDFKFEESSPVQPNTMRGPPVPNSSSHDSLLCDCCDCDCCDCGCDCDVDTKQSPKQSVNVEEIASYYSYVRGITPPEGWDGTGVILTGRKKTFKDPMPANDGRPPRSVSNESSRTVNNSWKTNKQVKNTASQKRTQQPKAKAKPKRNNDNIRHTDEPMGKHGMFFGKDLDHRGVPTSGNTMDHAMTEEQLWRTEYAEQNRFENNVEQNFSPEEMMNHVIEQAQQWRSEQDWFENNVEKNINTEENMNTYTQKREYNDAAVSARMGNSLNPADSESNNINQRRSMAGSIQHERDHDGPSENKVMTEVGTSRTPRQSYSKKSTGPIQLENDDDGTSENKVVRDMGTSRTPRQSFSKKSTGPIQLESDYDGPSVNKIMTDVGTSRTPRQSYLKKSTGPIQLENDDDGPSENKVVRDMGTSRTPRQSFSKKSTGPIQLESDYDGPSVNKIMTDVGTSRTPRQSYLKKSTGQRVSAGSGTNHNSKNDRKIDPNEENVETSEFQRSVSPTNERYRDFSHHELSSIAENDHVSFGGKRILSSIDNTKRGDQRNLAGAHENDISSDPRETKRSHFNRDNDPNRQRGSTEPQNDRDEFHLENKYSEKGDTNEHVRRHSKKLAEDHIPSPRKGSIIPTYDGDSEPHDQKWSSELENYRDELNEDRKFTNVDNADKYVQHESMELQDDPAPYDSQGSVTPTYTTKRGPVSKKLSFTSQTDNILSNDEENLSDLENRSIYRADRRPTGFPLHYDEHDDEMDSYPNGQRHSSVSKNNPETLNVNRSTSTIETNTYEQDHFTEADPPSASLKRTSSFTDERHSNHSSPRHSTVHAPEKVSKRDQRHSDDSGTSLYNEPKSEKVSKKDKRHGDHGGTRRSTISKPEKARKIDERHSDDSETRRSTVSKSKKVGKIEKRHSDFSGPRSSTVSGTENVSKNNDHKMNAKHRSIKSDDDSIEGVTRKKPRTKIIKKRKESTVRYTDADVKIKMKQDDAESPEQVVVYHTNESEGKSQNITLNILVNTGKKAEENENDHNQSFGSMNNVRGSSGKRRRSRRKPHKRQPNPIVPNSVATNSNHPGPYNYSALIGMAHFCLSQMLSPTSCTVKTMQCRFPSLAQGAGAGCAANCTCNNTNVRFPNRTWPALDECFDFNGLNFPLPIECVPESHNVQSAARPAVPKAAQTVQSQKCKCKCKCATSNSTKKSQKRAKQNVSPAKKKTC